MSEPDNPRGLCEVNGVCLSNMSRYLYSEHPESLSKREIRLVKKHLKDCPNCRNEVETKVSDPAWLTADIKKVFDHKVRALPGGLRLTKLTSPKRAKKDK